MGKEFDQIDAALTKFIQEQQMFFVASAPLSGDGLVNLSPKGLDSFRILGPNEVAYLDLTGSGVETLAHVKENGRITFMFCAMNGPAKILRLYGRAEVFEPGDRGFEGLLGQFPELPGVRSVIRAQITRIADSCGWGVPIYAFEKQRDQLPRYAESFSHEALVAAQQEHNARSLDGLVGVKERE